MAEGSPSANILVDGHRHDTAHGTAGSADQERHALTYFRRSISRAPNHQTMAAVVA